MEVSKVKKKLLSLGAALVITLCQALTAAADETNTTIMEIAVPISLNGVLWTAEMARLLPFY